MNTPHVTIQASRLSECRYCGKREHVRETYGWLLVSYRPTKEQFVNREFVSPLNFCCAEHLLRFYAEANGLDLVRRETTLTEEEGGK